MLTLLLYRFIECFLIGNFIKTVDKYTPSNRYFKYWLDLSETKGDTIHHENCSVSNASVNFLNQSNQTAICYTSPFPNALQNYD